MIYFRYAARQNSETFVTAFCYASYIQPDGVIIYLLMLLLFNHISLTVSASAAINALQFYSPGNRSTALYAFPLEPITEVLLIFPLPAISTTHTHPQSQ